MTVGVLRGGRGRVSGNDGGGVVGMTWLCCGNDVVVLWEWRGCVAGNGVVVLRGMAWGRIMERDRLRGGVRVD